MIAYTKDDVLDLAGLASYDRGMDYIDNVTRLAFDGTRVSATVAGTGRYRVELRLDDGLDGTCTCPYGEEGNFCKHCVAVALVYLYHAENGTLTASHAPAGLASYLASLDQAELVDILLTAAERDPALRQRLELRAMAQAGTDQDLDGATGHIDDLLAKGDYLGYGEAADYADRVRDLTAWLADLHKAGHGTSVIDLAQYALRRLGKASNNIDDSNGKVGGAAAGLAELHAHVCAEARPEPAELADWLLDFQTSGFAYPNVDVNDYIDSLGDAGLACYGELLTARWRALPDVETSYRDRKVVHLMEHWAKPAATWTYSSQS